MRNQAAPSYAGWTKKGKNAQHGGTAARQHTPNLPRASLCLSEVRVRIELHGESETIKFNRFYYHSHL